MLRCVGGTFAALLLMIVTLAGAHAAAGPWAVADNVKARLIAATDAVGDLATVPVGVELALKPGWKTYWRSPGDAGLAPTVDWTGSTNAVPGALQFPVPVRFSISGLQTFGYHDEVIFPVEAKPGVPGKPMALRGKLDLLVCAKLCVPQTLALQLDLPAGAATAAPEAQELSRFTSRVPADGTASGIAITKVRAIGAAALEITATSRTGFARPDVYPEADVGFGDPGFVLSPDRRTATVALPVTGKLPPNTTLAGRPITLTLIDGPLSAERKLTVEPGPAPNWGSALAALAPMLALAFLGGLILNLMPCVLPVLSLKLLSVISRGGQAHRHIRADFLATAAGVVFSFLVLAAGLIVLRATGNTIGWGIQFQQPVFIAAMIALSALFACNMWGFFEIPLPGVLSMRGGAGHDETLAAHFVTGAFATLLATPCSAPFLGTAVGFALVGGPAEILAVFLSLGVGLATPYLLVAARPSFAAALPKPGRWMLALRRILGFALIATAAWLLTILASLQSVASAVGIGLLIAATIAAMALRSRLDAAQKRLAGGAAAAAVVAVIGVAALGGRTSAMTASMASGDIAWVPFDRDRVRSLVAQGRTVFVDVTADWCLTCQANKRLVLDRQAVYDRIRGGAVVPMKADWTRPDGKISAFLAAYGKFGIPFNIVYGPGAPTGVVLPEVLSETGILGALDRVQSPI